MAKSAAERQAAYRKSRCMAGTCGDKRINTWVTTNAFAAIQRLAKLNGMTQRQTIEQLALMADQKILDTLKFDSPEWKEYFNVTQ